MTTSKATILIVEDEAKMRRLLELDLGDDGFRTVSAEDAETGLKLLQNGSVDLVITDLKLPGMNGLDFLQAVKRFEAAMPVIVMTAEGDVETAVRAMKAGADDFIEKPFSDDLLLGAINTASTRGRGPSRHREGSDAAERVARLSPRERQVLDALVAGRLNKQIAHDLGISARTVEVHRARMLRRLGVVHLADAIRLYVLAGLAE